jgi:hypothetical protein
MQIHKFIVSKNQVNYFFTKSQSKCLLVEYNPNEDYFGTSSGTKLEITIHEYNAFFIEKFEKITLADVPMSIQSVLTYLKINNKHENH